MTRKNVGVTRKDESSLDVMEILELEDYNILRSRLDRTKNDIDESYFEMAGLLYRAYDLGAHKSWGYEKWKDYVEEDLGISNRKAQYLMSIFQWIAVEIKDPEVREKIKGIGWTKVKELVQVANEDNIDEWIDKAKNMNFVELSEHARAKIRGEKEPTEKFHRMTFTLSADQAINVEEAIETAKEIANSDKKGHLLDLICTDFMQGNVFKGKRGEKLTSAYLRRLESVLGVVFVAFDKDTGDVVHGQEILDSRPDSVDSAESAV